MENTPEADLLAWGEAVEKAASNGRNVECLAQIIAAGAAMMGATTSSNERDFSALSPKVPQNVKLLLRRLQSDVAQEDVKKLRAAAQKIWRQGFGAPRRSGSRHRRPQWRDLTQAHLFPYILSSICLS